MDGWPRDMLIEWNEDGALVRVEPDSAALHTLLA